MAEVILTDQNFSAEVEQSTVPVLVDFWAPWCGPCRVTSPIVERLGDELADKQVKVGKLNVDENQATAEKFGIMSIPTFLFFKAGKVTQQLVGVQSEATLRQALLRLVG